jgi:hypothetical protein
LAARTGTVRRANATELTVNAFAALLVYIATGGPSAALVVAWGLSHRVVLGIRDTIPE